ncbi:hypothetical protein ACHMW5_13405 [Azospirillum melinis]|uniref:hypothetical protein n=1 Tax=Azospirillum melinis TaxID=328839 RepID=UPI0037579644
MTVPIPFRWQGDAFTPMPGHARRCDEAFVVGQVYHLIEQEDRSAASHRHFFACVKTAWENLTDETARRFPSPEHLRKFALIKAGYATSVDMPCASRAEALRWAPRIEGQNEYAIVTVTDAVVTVWTAKSQNSRTMNKAEFQASKDAVLTIIAGLIGTDPTTLAAQAGQAA